MTDHPVVMPEAPVELDPQQEAELDSMVDLPGDYFILAETAEEVVSISKYIEDLVRSPDPEDLESLRWATNKPAGRSMTVKIGGGHYIRVSTTAEDCAGIEIDRWCTLRHIPEELEAAFLDNRVRS